MSPNSGWWQVKMRFESGHSIERYFFGEAEAFKFYTMLKTSEPISHWSVIAPASKP